MKHFKKCFCWSSLLQTDQKSTCLIKELRLRLSIHCASTLPALPSTPSALSTLLAADVRHTVVLYVLSMSQHQSCKHLSGAESLSRVTPLPIIQGCDVGHTYISCLALSARNLPTSKGQPFQILISGDANTSIFCGTHFAGLRYLSKRCVFRQQARNIKQHYLVTLS